MGHWFTAVSALADGLQALPEGTRALLHIDAVTDLAGRILPLSDKGFGWLCPAVAGIVIGVIRYRMKRKRETE